MEEESVTTKAQTRATEMPIVKATGYQSAAADRVLVAQLVRGDENGKDVGEPIFQLSFMRTQVVPAGKSGAPSLMMEEAALATFALGRVQAEKLVKALSDQLETKE